MHSSRMRTGGGRLYPEGFLSKGSLSGRSYWKEHWTRDRDSPEGTWDQRQRPQAGIWGQASRQEGTSYRDPPQWKE